jgi:hypothetical protein
MDYYLCIRGSVQKFDELACKVALEGGTLNLAVLSLSGVFFQYSFYFGAAIVSFGSVVTTICFSIMAWFYSKLLGISVETAKRIEDELLPESWGSCKEKMGKKLTQNLDDYCRIFGSRLAGTQTWKVVLSEFIVLLFIGLILFFFYLSKMLLPTV